MTSSSSEHAREALSPEHSDPMDQQSEKNTDGVLNSATSKAEPQQNLPVNTGVQRRASQHRATSGKQKRLARKSQLAKAQGPESDPRPPKLDGNTPSSDSVQATSASKQQQQENLVARHKQQASVTVAKGMLAYSLPSGRQTADYGLLQVPRASRKAGHMCLSLDPCQAPV